MPQWVWNAVHDPMWDGDLAELTWRLAIRLVAAFVLGCLAAGIYRLTVRAGGPSTRSFLATLVLLSVLIALVTSVIGSNLARAFSLVGALAIVRFRTVVEDTRDTAFVIYAVVVGMGAGTGFLLAPVLGTPLVLLAAWLFQPAREEPSTGEGRLVLRLAATHPPGEEVGEALRRRLGEARLVSLATARGGAALDVTYAIRLPPPEEAVKLLVELNRLNGVQGVELKES
jgi:uncharacterized membrane protein YhiD involved in acid resistance